MGAYIFLFSCLINLWKYVVIFFDTVVQRNIKDNKFLNKMTILILCIFSDVIISDKKLVLILL